MRGGEETGLLVLVRHGTEVTSNDLKVRVMADIVLCHFEHSKVKISYGAEGATRDQNDWLFCGITHDPSETV